MMNATITRIRQRLSPQRFPDTAEDLAKSDLFTGWWYYSVKLLPNLITKGHCPDSFPMLPRIPAPSRCRSRWSMTASGW